MEEEMEICSNCKREIPSINYVMHSVHCHRNIAVCPKCKEPVPRSELGEHDRSEHSHVPCQACGQLVENSQMSVHKAQTCLHRRVTCVFCELDLGAGEKADHENYCGSRTEKCDECGEFVMIKYRGLHLDSNHGFIKLSDEPVPPAFWKPAKTNVAKRTPEPLKNSPLRSIFTPSSTHVNSSALAPPNFGLRMPYSSSEMNKKSSPAKRENHQPQVNTNQKTAEKNCEAPIDENLDRLLALRLAQEEMEMVSSSTVPEFKTPPIAMMQAFITDSDDEEELAAALVDRPPPRNTVPIPDQALPVDSADVKLPCEFCDVLVPASRLVLHQTGCRPDLARYKPLGGRDRLRPLPARSPVTGRLSMLHNDLSDEPTSPPPRYLKKFGGERKSPTTGDMIPCDLCDTSVPSSNFMQHQLACEIHHLPGRQQASRPQALVMPLSGRALKVKTFPSSPPSAKNLMQTTSTEKTSSKQTMPGDTPAKSSQPSLKQSRSGANSSAGHCDSPQRNGLAHGGAVPKQKAGRNTGQVSQEPPSSPSTFSLGSRSRVAHPHPRRPIDYQRNPLD